MCVFFFCSRAGLRGFCEHASWQTFLNSLARYGSHLQDMCFYLDFWWPNSNFLWTFFLGHLRCESSNQPTWKKKNGRWLLLVPFRFLSEMWQICFSVFSQSWYHKNVDHKQEAPVVGVFQMFLQLKCHNFGIQQWCSFIDVCTITPTKSLWMHSLIAFC